VEKNLFCGRGKTLAAVLLLLAASVASASPTIISDSSIPIASRLTDDAADIVSYAPVSRQLSDLAESFLKPPQVDNQTTQEGNNHYIPVLPPAIGMVLLGFICVSLFKDRKSWLAVIAFLFAAGQTGIWALPELTSRIGRKVHNSQPTEPALADLYSLRDGFYPANYDEQIRYTGLLHHLAGIPRLSTAFSNVIKKDTRVLQHAFVFSQLGISRANDCLISGTKQFICFTPAFIFNLIPRGPPCSTWVTT
jgi:hypothetical protein